MLILAKILRFVYTMRQIRGSREKNEILERRRDRQVSVRSSVVQSCFAILWRRCHGGGKEKDGS